MKTARTALRPQYLLKVHALGVATQRHFLVARHSSQGNPLHLSDKNLKLSPFDACELIWKKHKQKNVSVLMKQTNPPIKQGQQSPRCFKESKKRVVNVQLAASSFEQLLL